MRRLMRELLGAGVSAAALTAALPALAVLLRAGISGEAGDQVDQLGLFFFFLHVARLKKLLTFEP